MDSDHWRIMCAFFHNAFVDSHINIIYWFLNFASYIQVLKAFKDEALGGGSLQRYENMLTSHTVAKFLAKEFSEALDVLKGTNVGDRLEYLDSCVVDFKTSNTTNYRYDVCADPTEMLISGKCHDCGCVGICFETVEHHITCAQHSCLRPWELYISLVWLSRHPIIA